MAREAAGKRFKEEGWTCNAQAGGEWLRANTGQKSLAVVNEAMRKKHLSLRGADRTLRLAWTLADLDGRYGPNVDDVAVGIMMRTRTA